MITNPDWLKPEEKPYFRQISLDCIEKLVKCIARFNKGEVDADTSSKIEKQILVNEFDEPEFFNYAIENYSEMFGYIVTGRANIRIHREDGPPPIASLRKLGMGASKMLFGVG